MACAAFQARPGSQASRHVVRPVPWVMLAVLLAWALQGCVSLCGGGDSNAADLLASAVDLTVKAIAQAQKKLANAKQVADTVDGFGDEKAKKVNDLQTSVGAAKTAIDGILAPLGQIEQHVEKATARDPSSGSDEVLRRALTEALAGAKTNLGAAKGAVCRAAEAVDAAAADAAAAAAAALAAAAEAHPHPELVDADAGRRPSLIADRPDPVGSRARWAKTGLSEAERHLQSLDAVVRAAGKLRVKDKGAGLLEVHAAQESAGAEASAPFSCVRGRRRRPCSRSGLFALRV